MSEEEIERIGRIVLLIVAGVIILSLIGLPTQWVVEWGSSLIIGVVPVIVNLLK